MFKIKSVIEHAGTKETRYQIGRKGCVFTSCWSLKEVEGTKCG
jgi:hypothetical protein